jgi:hypothetical protein
MSGRLLDFSQFLGGADDVKVIEMFPRDRKAFTYNFGSNVSSYTFSGDYQTILLDTVTYDRITGLPNFTDTTVIGYFTNTANLTVGTGNFDISNASASTGFVKLTIPENRYTGNVIPNARNYVPCTVLSFEWQDNSTPAQKQRHRYCILERFDPQVGKVPGDPRNETNYVALTVTA